MQKKGERRRDLSASGLVSSDFFGASAKREGGLQVLWRLMEAQQLLISTFMQARISRSNPLLFLCVCVLGGACFVIKLQADF